MPGRRVTCAPKTIRKRVQRRLPGNPFQPPPVVNPDRSLDRLPEGPISTVADPKGCGHGTTHLPAAPMRESVALKAPASDR